MEGASASGQLAWPPHRGNRHSGGEEYGRHGDSAASDESVHTRRRYTVAVSAAALIAAVCCVTAFMSEPQTSTTTLEEASASSSSPLKTPKVMEAQISKLMREVRRDSLDEQRAVQRRERVELQLEEHSEWLQQQQHSSKHHAISPESLDDVLGGGAVHQSIDELKGELSAASATARADKEKRAAVQKTLDHELNALSTEQIAAHQAQVKQQLQQRAALLSAAQHSLAHTDALAGKPTAAEASAGEELLASVGEQLLKIPAVAKALTQALGSSDLDLAREIAKSLGQNATDLPPIDPAIAAEAEIAAAEKEQGLPLQDDKATPALNISALVHELPPHLVEEMEQAQREIEIQKKLQN